MPPRQPLRESAVLFVACLAVGLPATLTAAAPDFVALAWPPVGVGLVAVWLRGRSLLPAYFFATYLLLALPRLSTGGAAGGLEAAVLATAYSAQLLLGTWLLRRAVGAETLLTTPRDIAAFLAVVGPLHAVVAASAGVALAYAGGRVDGASAATAWADWWRTDTLGGLLFAPLALVALGRPCALWGPRVATVAAPLVLTLALLAAGQKLADDSEGRVVRAAYAREVASALREAGTELRRVELAALRSERFVCDDLLPGRDRPGVAAASLGEFAAQFPSVRSVVAVARVPPNPARPGRDVATAVAPPGEIPLGDPAWAQLIGEASWARRPAVGRAGERLVRVVVPCGAPPGPLQGFVAVELDLAVLLDGVGDRLGESLSLDPAGAGDPPARPHVEGELTLLGKAIAVRGTLTPEYEARHRPVYSPAAGLLGVGLYAALASLLLLATGQAVAAGREVEDRTRDLLREAETRAEVESDLRHSEEWLREAQRITRLGYWEWRADADELVWSAAMTDLLGLQGSDIRLRLDDFLDRVHPDDRDAVRRLVVGMPGVAHPVDVEFRVVRPDGLVRWFTSTVASTAGRGRGTIRGTALDITDRKRTELALREGEARLRLALHSARMGTWEWVIGTGDVYWDLRQEAIFGFSPGSFNRTLEGFRQRVHPDDREAVFGALVGYPDDSTTYATEFRIVLPCGEVRWVAGFGQVLAAEGRRPRLVGINFDVTERKLAELAIQESDLRHRLALEAGHMGTMVWDFRTDRVSWDDRLHDLFGVAATDFDGTVAGFFVHVHPSDREALAAHLGRSRQNPLGGKCNCEFRTAPRDGRTRWLSGNGHVVATDVPGHLRMVAIFFDITEEKSAEDRLLASEERLHEAQEISRIGSFEWYPLTGEVTWSEEMFRLFGYEPSAVAPSYEAFAARVHPDDRALVAERFHAAVHGGADYCYEFRLALPGGEVRHLSVNARITRDESGRVTLFRGTNQDITERKRESEERRRFRDQLTEAQRLESLGILAGGVAHDFNNLLTGILGNASLAREALSRDSEIHEYLRPIEKSAEHAAHLCHQMLTYAGAGKTILGALDLDAVIAESDDLIKLSASRKADCRVELRGGLPPIEADAGQIRQVLLNLVQNASEALPPGGGRVTVRTGHAEPFPPPPTDDTTTFGVPPEAAAVWLEVEDGGCGMSAANRQRIFEPFFTTKFTGRGLGLSAVHGIVRDHGGCISVTSRVGHGTTFRVAFPCAGAPVAQAGPAVSSRTPTPATWDAAARRTALVADDEPAILGLVSFALKGLGFAVEKASTGAEAIAQFLEDPQRFQVVVLDLIMPGADGREVLDLIRQHRPDLPVIVMSGYTEHQLADIEFGEAVSFLHKPFRAIDLTGAVRRTLVKNATPADGTRV